MKVIRFSGLCILALLFLLGTNRLQQARAADTEADKSNARRQISQLKEQISKQTVSITAASVVVAGAKAALKKEENKPCPDVGKVIALALAVGVAEAAKSELQKEKAATEKSLAYWEARLAELGG